MLIEFMKDNQRNIITGLQSILINQKKIPSTELLPRTFLLATL